MKKLYFVKTNGYNMLVSVSGHDARYLTETAEFPTNPTPEQALNFLKSVEDDSSWESDCKPEQIFVQGVEVIAECESEI